MKRTGDGSCDSGYVICVVKALACVKLTSAGRELNDDWGVILACCLQTCVDSRAGDAVDCGDSVPVLLGVVEQIDEALPRDYSRVN